MKLHHVGIVVSNIKNSLEEINRYLNFDHISSPALIMSQKVNVCFLQAGETYLELIEPAEENSPVSNFLNKGGGIHHFCFEVNDIHEAIDDIVKKGATLIVKPVKGFENRLTAFVYLNMKNTKCNLIEFAEPRPRAN